MAMKYCWILGLALLLFLLTLGCGELGKVDQGRVVEFDKAKGTVTLIREKADPPKSDYSILPPCSYTIPADPEEMGAEPKVGYRMKLDTKKNQIVIFNPASQNLKTIHYTLIDQKDNIAKDNPLVFDKAEEKPKKFPVIDREKKTIAIYSGAQKILITFTVPEEYFALPDKAWDAGDEVRIYYKEEGKARRLMNVSKIDIFKK